MHLTPQSQEKQSAKIMRRKYKWKTGGSLENKYHEDSVIEPWEWKEEIKLADF
jgi:hypothetical protein